MTADEAASMAGVLDALRGGNNGFLAERQAARMIETYAPAVPRMIAWADAWHARKAAEAAEAGAAAVIFGGAGYPFPATPRRFDGVPVTRSLHAAAANAGAWCGYPHPDTVVNDLRALSLEGDSGVVAFTASVLDAPGLMEAAARAGMSDGPVHVQWGLAALALGWQQACDLAAAYREVLAGRPGSTLTIAVPEMGSVLAGMAGAHAHKEQDIITWADRAGLLLDEFEPAEDVRHPFVRDGWALKYLRQSAPRVVAAVARVPQGA